MRPIVFAVLFYSWTTLAGIMVLPLLPGPPRYLLAYSRFWIRVSLWLLRVTVGLSHEVRGQENIPDGPALFAIKHQSAWDTLAINLIIHDAAIVLKRELTWIPIFGWCLVRARQVPIDRGGGLSVLRNMVTAAQARVAEGRPVVIFPEGTRVPPGTHVPYQAGISALNNALDIPVVPVALNSGLFWPRRSLALRPGRITIEFLPQLPDVSSRKEFVQSLETAIENSTSRLIAEAIDRYDLPPLHVPVDKVVEERQA
jgi:1-acyl-sn-glycerol-3-phosphate acyltransferase